MNNEDLSFDEPIDKTVDVTRYVFHAPNPNLFLLIVVLISILMGFGLTFDLNDIGSNFEAARLLSSAITYGFVILGLPSIITIAITTPLAIKLGGIFYYRRSVLLAFVSTLVFGFIIIICKLITIFIDLELIVILIFGYSVIFVIRHSTLVTTSNSHHLKSFPASINQTALGFLMIMLMPAIAPWISTSSLLVPEYSFGVRELLLMVGFGLIFIATTLLWINSVSRPFRKEYNTDGLDLAAYAMRQFTEPSGSNFEDLENFFDSFGVTIDTTIGAVCLKARNSGARDKKFKAIIIVPGIHPGPFGQAGGSNLPLKLAKELGEYSRNIMVFHSATTHDYNPVKTVELKKMVKVLKEMLKTKNLEFSSDCSRFVRLGTTGSVQISAQMIGNGILLLYTSSPVPTDDIGYEVGEKAASLSARSSKMVDKALFIDAHNCLEKGVNSVRLGSEKGAEILKLVKRAVTKLDRGHHASGPSQAGLQWLRAGVANSVEFTTREGFGPQGMQVLVIETATADPTSSQKVAYILFDGNNVIPTLRERILDNIGNLVDNAEIFTSDNHIVNNTMGGYNPVGLKCSQARIISTSTKLVKQAIADLEEVEAVMTRRAVKNMKLFGHGNTVRLSTTINSTISAIGKNLVGYNILAVLGSIVFYLII